MFDQRNIFVTKMTIVYSFVLRTIPEWPTDIHHAFTSSFFYGFDFVYVGGASHSTSKAHSPNDSEIGYYFIYEAMHCTDTLEQCKDFGDIEWRMGRQRQSMRVKMFNVYAVRAELFVGFHVEQIQVL